MTIIDILSRFAVALFIGLLVGLERGWQSRESEEGSRIAGMRTFALISVMGAVVYRLADTLGAVFFGFAFASLTILLMAAHAMTSYRKAEYGITTTIAAFNRSTGGNDRHLLWRGCVVLVSQRTATGRYKALD